MGDLRFAPPYEEILAAPDRAAAIASLNDEAVIGALAEASRRNDPYLANVLATEATNRLRAARVEALAKRSTTAPDFQQVFKVVPGLYLVLSPEYQILGVSDAYLKATLTEREEILARYLFEVFPDNPADPEASGARNLKASLENVRSTGHPHRMAIQRYDIPRHSPETGFEERYWSPVNIPVLGSGGEVLYIIHCVEDVTELVLLKRRQAGPSREAITPSQTGRKPS